jgi:hypothetical protein
MTVLRAADSKGMVITARSYLRKPGNVPKPLSLIKIIANNY